MVLGILVSLLVVVVGFADWAALRKEHPRALLLEFAGFLGVVVLALRAEWFQFFAKELGVHRAVDLIIYPVLVWLFREAVLGRVRYHRQQREITRLVRSLAIDESRRYEPERAADKDARSSAP